MAAYWGSAGYGYGLGVRVPLGDGKRTDYGWGGAAGAFAAVDPVNDITVYYSQHVIASRFAPIRKDFIEAAKLDGAGEWKIFRHICVPMSSSIVYSVALLIFIDYWNMVEQPLIMLSDPETHPLSVFLSNLNTQDTGIAFAAATVYMVVPMLLFLYSEDYLVKGISYSGGIK
jgi:multiple sugar transport system permease protein